MPRVARRWLRAASASPAEPVRESVRRALTLVEPDCPRVGRPLLAIRDSREDFERAPKILLPVS